MEYLRVEEVRIRIRIFWSVSDPDPVIIKFRSISGRPDAFFSQKIFNEKILALF